MRSNRSEYSRYYGDFRGVDFSSDHTLVADSRFPYLVNMYKDYAAGGGQGIETIPGFRRRFVAPNGGRIHGIHSYKDKSGKRHVLVHAGDSLYKWGNFPHESGFAKEIVAVVKEYDEYSSDIEGVGIATDYLKVEIHDNYYFPSGTVFDVRSICKLNSAKGISIYPESLDGATDDSVYYVPNAYTFSQVESGEYSGHPAYTVTLKIPKEIKDSGGTVVFSAVEGDTIKVKYYSLEKEVEHVDQGYNFGNSKAPSISDTNKTSSSGERIIKLLWPNYNTTSYHYLIGRYGWEGTFYTPLSVDSVPKVAGWDDVREFVGKSTKICSIQSSDGETFAPCSVEKGNYTVRMYALYNGEGEVSGLGAESFYQYSEDGTRVYLSEEIDGLRIRCRDRGSVSLTATELDEYADEGKTDYNYVDISSAPELQISEISLENGNKISSEKYRREGDILLFAKSDLEIGKSVTVMFGETKTAREFGDMNDRDSTSFVFGEKLYILDGKNYLVYDSEEVEVDKKVMHVRDNAYVPTTYINTIVGGENAGAGQEKEPRNILTPYFKQTFIPDGETTTFYLNETNLDGITKVKLFGEELEKGTDYDEDLVKGCVTFNVAPKPRNDFPEEYAGVEITAKKWVYPITEGEGEDETTKSLIDTATIATVFDKHVFFSGIPSKPNFILWSALENPHYVGILNYEQDGIGTSPITAMITVGNSLMVLKGDTEEGGAVYYHTPIETNIDVTPVAYPSVQGLAGIGCLGAACNFLDDPVFVSRLGLEAIGKLNLSYERSMEHRSSLIDAKLVNLPNLASAKLCEWSGYLVLLVDGKIFLADSRQSYADNTGVLQYEWYYLEDIGVFEKQYKRYEYLREFPMILMSGDERADIKVTYQGAEYTIGLISDIRPDAEMIEVPDKIEKVTADVDCNGIKFTISAAMYPENDTYYACLCDTTGEQIGGVFKPAVVIRTIDDNLYFGTENGVVCSFNFDKRVNGAIPADYYTFDGRAIYSGCALKMDNCGIPHLTKTTVKKSTVVKVKSFMRTAAKIRVRTNKNPFNEIARINGTRFSFDDMDFSDFSFVVGDDTLFAVREKEKKWVEKQYYLYSDEYKKPFALYYLAYRYFVAGKYKG